ncbi:unnamed protein product [Closterium sp. Naga37s-1]|nr:unnamed protein product [Closterium sp. Naga37s-1]
MASRLLAAASRAARSASGRRSGSIAPFRPFSAQAAPAAVQTVDEDRFARYNSPIPVTVDHSAALGLIPATRVTTLSNGLRVASEANPNPNAPKTATIGVWIDAGSRYESEATNGTAHFLEHMIFKGTKRRSVQQLEMEVENAGGHLNAYTSREMTTYYAKVVQKDIPVAVDLLGDILQNSLFSEDAVDRERGVILREMQEIEKQVEEVLFDHLHATAFQFSPLGRTILGSADNVRAITRNDLEKYIATHYTGPRMVVSAAGAVDHDALVKVVEKTFASLPAASTTTVADLIAKEPSKFTGSEVRIRDDDMPLTNFAIAYKGASWTDPDAVALQIMQTMLGSWSRGAGGGNALGSELAQKVAANGLCERFMAFNTNYSDTGLFGVYACAKPDHLDDLAWAMMHEITRLVYRVSDDDVTRAGNALKASLALHLDGSSAVAEDIGRQLITYGRRIPLAEMFARIDAVDADTVKRVAERFLMDRMFARIDAVDAETVKRVAERFLLDRDVAVAAIGPTQFLPDYNWLHSPAYLVSLPTASHTLLFLLAHLTRNRTWRWQRLARHRRGGGSDWPDTVPPRLQLAAFTGLPSLASHCFPYPSFPSCTSHPQQDVAVAAIGPTQFLPDYNWLRRRTFWLRY